MDRYGAMVWLIGDYMYVWIFVVVSFLVIGLVLSARRKSAKKAEAQKLVRRSPLRPAPFEVHHFDNSEPAQSAQETRNREAIQAYISYCATYKRLLTGEPVSDIVDYPQFVTDAAVTAHDGNMLDRFIRSAFHSDVLYGYLTLEFEKSLKQSIEIGMAQHWHIGPLGEAALIAFRRTREVRFLELYRRFFDRFMMLRDTQLGYYDHYHEKVMDSWGAYNLGKNAGRPGLWVAHITHFSVCMLPAIGFARDISGNPALSTYREWASNVIDFFQKTYAEFDADYRDVDGVPEKWYWRPLLNKYEATNHMHLLGQALLNLYTVTKNEIYAERIRSFIRIFEQGATIHDNGMASWKYSPYFQVANEKNGHISRQYCEYTWKGEITVPFLYEAKAEGFEIKKEVLDGVTSSIRDHILKDANYKLHVHPQSSRPISARDRKKANSIESGISGYHAAATEDEKIEQQVIDIVAHAPALFPIGWLSQPRLARSYARLLPVSLHDQC